MVCCLPPAGISTSRNLHPTDPGTIEAMALAERVTAEGMALPEGCVRINGFFATALFNNERARTRTLDAFGKSDVM